MKTAAKRPKIAIIGAGMGGSVAAHFLSQMGLNVTVVVEDGPLTVKDVGQPARLWPHVGSGSGGTTRFWHNGLIEPDRGVWKSWPGGRSALLGYLRRVYPLLSGTEMANVEAEAVILREKHKELGVPGDMLGGALFYPKTRRNMWQHLRLDGKVRVLQGKCLPLTKPKDGVLKALQVETERGVVTVEADAFVLAAGGLGTPLLLEDISKQAGRHYDDHPTGFMAEVTLHQSFYKLWNYRAEGIDGTFRQPLVVDGKHGAVAFYLRPAFHRVSQAKRDKVTSVLSDLRNKPGDIRNYMKLLNRVDDVLDILSFKLGINVQTRQYTVLMVAEMAPDGKVAVWAEKGAVMRDWRLSKDYLDGLEAAVHRLMERLGGLVEKYHVLPGWRETFTSSSHHSGTARIATSAKDGVCDADGLVFGTKNVFVADGSALPATGYANTGLLIAAHAARVAEAVGRVVKAEKKMSTMSGTVDFVVTGAGGFIGSRLIPLLEKRGLTAVDAVTFEQNPDLKAAWCLHLANVHGSPTANDQLMRDILTKYRERVTGWVVPMTFASLQGGTDLRADKLNMGLKPWRLGPYVAGKVLQEQTIVASGVGPVLMPYLPLIADANSPWDMQLQQMKKHGYAAGGTFTEGTGPQVIELKDLADWLKDMCTPKVKAQPGRVVRAALRNPKYAATWAKVLAPYPTVPFTFASAVSKVKFAIWFMIQLALGIAWRLGLLKLATRILWRSKTVPVVRRRYEVGHGPAIFEPFDATFTQRFVGDLERPKL